MLLTRIESKLATATHIVRTAMRKPTVERGQSTSSIETRGHREDDLNTSHI